MVISQGDVCWASLDDPVGSAPGFRRPVAVVQGDPFNASRIATAVVVPLTSDLRLAAAPGNVLLPAERTGLPQDSVANVSQITTIDRMLLSERVGRLSSGDLRLVLAGIDVVLGRG
ncbi:type II toxin-antitoxin system PemK/MazF family toxin [Conexibacter arvalis]|uniref:mRNA interferase n=1 Tax=Conexibacter arvalis TaxID=912552 RepID=A0A840IG40_9ACTN|nr:type II toxin-antitoxin system PemK/MazF family toxin [Conexibacter arvalis]MBB4663779.1 mRNA interferase MazF [Conexibacter arvalis]